MRLWVAFAETRPNRARVGHSCLVERADRSSEPGLRHVAEATGLVPPHRKLLVVEDELAEQCDLLRAVQGCGLRLFQRFGLDAVDLQFDGLDLFSGRGWNWIPIGCCGRDHHDRSRTRHTYVTRS